MIRMNHRKETNHSRSTNGNESEVLKRKKERGEENEWWEAPEIQIGNVNKGQNKYKLYEIQNNEREHLYI